MSMFNSVAEGIVAGITQSMNPMNAPVIKMIEVESDKSRLNLESLKHNLISERSDLIKRLKDEDPQTFKHVIEKLERSIDKLL